MRSRAALIASRTALYGTILVGCLSLSEAATSKASDALGAPASLHQSLTRALGSAKDAGSARITVQFFSGSTNGRVVQDSTLHTGKQTVAIKNELASVVLTGDTAYISGNSSGLTSYFGLPSSLVSTLAGKWVSVQSADTAFQSVSANISLSSALANVTPSGTLVGGKRSKVDDQWVKSISGQAPGGEGRLTLFVALSKKSLPVEAVESSGSGKSAKGEIVTFTRWGEQVHVPTPAGALPLSALQAASSASK
jgi:hypothetical protein